MGKIKISRADKRVFKLTDRIQNPFDLTNHLPFRVATAANLMALNRDLNIRQQTGLETREMRVLINIGSYMPITSADIAYQSRMETSSISRSVSVLIQKGLIEALKDPTNRRNKKLVLTNEGQTLYDKLSVLMDDRSKVIEKALTAQEKETLFSLLDRIESETEKHLAEFALSEQASGEDIPADQKELIRWYRKSNES